MFHRLLPASDRRPYGGLVAHCFFAGLLAWAGAGPAPATAQVPTAPSVSAATGGLPQLGDGADMAHGTERRLGDRIVRELYRDPDYLDDPVIMDYVQGIWQPLLAAARQRGELTPEMDAAYAWDILLGRDKSVNAFALPGAYLGLHLGLVAAVSNRDELASVLAHELSHVTQRHISRMVTRQSEQAPWLLGTMILGMLAASKSAHAANAMIVGGQAVAAQTQLNFSRDMEREADRVGFGVAAQAGYAPQGFVSMFDKLQQASRLNDTGNFPYLRSHPLTTERMADMQNRIGPQLGAAPMAVVAEHAMVAARARVLAHGGVDALRAWAEQAQPAALERLEPGARAGVGYGATLAALKLRDFAQAQAHWQRLQGSVRGDAAAERLVRLLGAELALAQGDAAAALQRLGPDARDRGAMTRATEMLLASSLQAAEPARAAERLQAWLADHPRDALAWDLLSAVYTAQGRKVHAVRAQAEASAARLDFADALARYRAAQDLVRLDRRAVDHIEASIVDTRARQIEARLREDMAERGPGARAGS